jgi:hypothetical protein
MLAVFGRQPSILPNLEEIASHHDDSHTGPDGLSRGRHRLRELSVQAMVEATALQRMTRAANTKTRQSVEAKQLVVGDQVEFYRKPGQKDTQGWRGPASVLKIGHDGNIDIKWQGSALICRAQDVRKAILFSDLQLSFMSDDADKRTNTPIRHLIEFVEEMTQGTVVTVSVVNDGKTNVLSQRARQQPLLLHAILSIAANDLHLSGCVGARLAHGLVKLPPLPSISDTLLWTWPQYRSRSSTYTQSNNTTTIHTNTLAHKHVVDNVCTVQFLLRPQSEIDDLQHTFPDVPHLGATNNHPQQDHHQSVNIPTHSPDDPMRRGTTRPRSDSNTHLDDND